MGIKTDGRPTLASWPKRIYDWEELPAPFRPALEDWRGRGMPPGNVTYIPRVHQHKNGVEHVTAWLGDEVMLLSDNGNGVEALLLRPDMVDQVAYTVELLRCTVEITLDGGRRVAFSYNKTKEDQLLPVLNLLLGNEPEYRAAGVHPARGDLERLLAESYAMYYTALLCYRFGGEIRDSLWLRGKGYGWPGQRRQKPEWLLAKMDRGLVGIATQFYGTRTVYLKWERLGRVSVGETAFPPPGPRRRPALSVAARDGSGFCIPLLPEQIGAAERFSNGLGRIFEKE